MSLANIARTATITTALVLGACEAPELRQDVLQRTKGTVIREDGTLPGLVRSNGALFGNESVRLDEATYILHIKTNDGTVYVAQVHGSYQRSTHVLESALDSGSVIMFPMTCQRPSEFDSRQSCFGNDRIGRLPANSIALVTARPDSAYARKPVEKND